MEINPCPDAISHHQFHFLVVPSLRRTAGPVGDDEPVPATAGLAAEGADEVSRRALPHHRRATIARRCRPSCAAGDFIPVDPGPDSQCTLPDMMLMWSLSAPARPD